MTATTEKPTDPMPRSMADGGQALLTWLARRPNPVSYDAHAKAWHVTGYAEVMAVLMDPETFSSDFSGLVPPAPGRDRFMTGNFVGMDDPEHRKLRKLVSQAFTPRMVAGLEPRIREISAGLLADLGKRETFDLVSDFAYPLPVIVIAEMLGIPIADRDRFRAWADTLLDVEAPESLDDLGEVLDGQEPVFHEMADYLLERIAEKRANPGDDLISKLCVVEVDGESLTDEEMVGFVALLLLAGHITTTALLGNTFLCLAENPAAAAALRADRSLVPAAVEEVLRVRSPFTRVARVTTREVEFAGQTIPAGVFVLPWLMAANRDPRVFADPDRFDIRREGKQLAFGHGVHVCIGAPLARLEARVAVPLLLDHFADIEVVADEATFYESNGMVSAKHLPLRVRAA
ncbi:cytochrome P450 [Actinokineospora iranica]|uniref:Cytochrome P450 n=1 Tax=Actinokineospora iranica TaxID=1271860 RepID=A0A1G6ZGK1_9PSEU|nr:cytochrome P450 [Actinokineospora iranica]SDE01513.1 Cytochrome P450 [Actinokineospora iranica]